MNTLDGSGLNLHKTIQMHKCR